MTPEQKTEITLSPIELNIVREIPGNPEYTKELISSFHEDGWGKEGLDELAELLARDIAELIDEKVREENYACQGELLIWLSFLENMTGFQSDEYLAGKQCFEAMAKRIQHK